MDVARKAGNAAEGGVTVRLLVRPADSVEEVVSALLCSAVAAQPNA
jgi:hypothetical protein